MYHDFLNYSISYYSLVQMIHINIYVSASILCGIVEYRKARTHEEAAVVEAHSEAVAHFLELLSVCAVIEGGTILMVGEVGFYAQPHILALQAHAFFLFRIG